MALTLLNGSGDLFLLPQQPTKRDEWVDLCIQDLNSMRLRATTF